MSSRPQRRREETPNWHRNRVDVVMSSDLQYCCPWKPSRDFLRFISSLLWGLYFSSQNHRKVGCWEKYQIIKQKTPTHIADISHLQSAMSERKVNGWSVLPNWLEAKVVRDSSKYRIFPPKYRTFFDRYVGTYLRRPQYTNTMKTIEEIASLTSFKAEFS